MSNRIIKFRAWDKKEMVMIGDADSEADFRFHAGSVTVRYLSEQFYEGGGEIHSRDRWEDCDVEVMQFTGLIDKNGKEVYEGDVVTMRSYNYSHLDYQKWEVKYFPQGMMFEFHCLSKPNQLSQNILGYHSIEVIGNTYETPNLLSSPSLPT